MKRPNFLFILPDQHRADWTGANPNLPLRTPHLDQLAGSGLRCDQAFTPCPLCAPARACLASGRDYAHCGVPSNRENFPLSRPTYYQSLRELGYEVCGVGKLDLHKNLAAPLADLDWGLDGSHSMQEWGFTCGIDNEGKFDAAGSFRAAGRPKGPYMAALQRAGLAELYIEELHASKDQQHAYVSALPEDLYLDNWIAENGLRFLQNFEANKPWHLVVNFAGPHAPMDVTARMAEEWAEVDFPVPSNAGPGTYSPEDHQRNRRHYAAMIENIDRQIGRFIAAVEARGELDNTLIVYSSDHGEMLGEHGLWGKKTPEEAAIRIPLIIAGLNTLKNQKTSALIALQDIGATFLDLAGAPQLPDAEAKSFSRLLTGETERHRDRIVSAYGDWKVVHDGRYKAIFRGDPNNPEIYDIREDPEEANNLARTHKFHIERLLQPTS